MSGETSWTPDLSAATARPNIEKESAGVPKRTTILVTGATDGGLEVRDCPLYNIAKLVDLSVEFILPGEKFTTDWLSDGREHVVPDVSLVAEPITGIYCVQNRGLLKAVRVVTATVDRI
jgi:hypothetical protein